MNRKAKKSQEIRDKTGVNFRQHAFLGGVAFRREPCYIKCNPENPWDYEIVSVEKYNDMCAKMEFGEDNDWYATNRLVPIEGNIRKLRFLEEQEYNRLTEAVLWSEILEELEIYNWENFDTAFAELEKRKKERDQND